ncbi:MAG: hypothetical protein CVV06_04130 [Gammaproteobacteria bacterium HGW-Gammaproteobacteria-10]|nr:MAG: hypothetical protein CVV06_04130 [Gammaproteobacteria bacterium HGW-Gammaproteobacteria-10]
MFSLIVIALLSTVAMLMAWVWQQNHKNAGIVDVIWSFGMMLAGPWYALTGTAPLYLQLSLALLTFAWFLRLGSHLSARVFGEPEDGRYQAMRAAMQDKADSGFLQFFLLQAGFIWVLSLPFWAVAHTRDPNSVMVFCALLVACLALWGETTADRQLAEFRKNPDNCGLTCRTGWWRYSRHPNYFFEWLHWFAYPLMGWGGEYQYWLWLAPVVMFCFLYFLTGIPYTEQQALRSRGDDYRRYQQTTSKFLPWYPKSTSPLQNRFSMLNAIELAERGLIPDPLMRIGIRNLLRQRLRDEYANDVEQQSLRYLSLLQTLRESPIAIETDAANRQHYEVPAAFYRYALGKHLKYSSCYWDETTQTLDEAEARMLRLTCERAELAADQQILELGCGWGSLTLWMAEHYPRSTITAVSNSNSQREYILEQAELRGLRNLDVITCDVNRLSLTERYDRVVSVEMFEHMRNYGHLMSNIASWLKPGGKLFVHIFCHRYLAYPFETEGDDNWMGRYFFTGGLMPARDTLLHFQDRLQIERQWDVSGQHYQKTSEAWLSNMDRHPREIDRIFAETYGREQAAVWRQRWRLFFMACAELFGYRGGNEWLVTHYRFIRPSE